MRQDGSVCRASDAPYYIAALAAVGRAGEAEAFAAAVLPHVGSGAAAFALAHLGMASALTSIPRAHQFLRDLGRLTKRSRDDESRFWTFHTIARIRFAQGRFRSALGIMTAVPTPMSPYAHYLFHELQALCLAPQARLEEAAEHFDRAAAAARGLQNDAALASLSLQRWLASMRYAPNSADALSDEAFRALSPLQRASHSLEVARRAAVTGELALAEGALADAAEAIAATGSARYETAFILRRIDILLARGLAADARIGLRRLAASLEPRREPVLALDLAERFVSIGASVPFDREALLKRTSYVPPEAPSLATRKTVEEIPKAVASVDLNLRQIELLKEMREGEAVDVHAYRQRFAVAEITASRDLARLAALALLTRVGKARATRYVKPIPAIEGKSVK